MKLSVLVASFGDQSQKFIDMSYASIEKQTIKSSFEIIHVSSGDFVPILPTVNVTHFHSQERMHFPVAINKAFELSNKESEFILLLNDDCVMGKDTIQTMMEISERADIIVNPMSSCQNGRWYQCPMGFYDKKGEANIFTKNQFLYEEMADHLDDIIERSIVHSPMFFYTEWVAFFCTMMRRSTWNKVGGICTEFQTGADDLDFSIRAKKLGIQCGIITNASVMHFSGSSANLHLSDESRNFNRKLFKERHGRDI